MATLYDKIRTQHTTGLDTEIKDYLPIIGNEIPNKLITNFDENETITPITDSGNVVGAYDYKKSYHGNACYKLDVQDVGAGGIGRVQLNFTTPIDLINLSESSNNYAEIKQTGKYGNDEDKLFLVVNALVTLSGGGFSGRIIPRIYNGARYAECNAIYAEQYSIAIGNDNRWIKTGWEMNNTTFSYNNGFLNADWENVTKIEFVCDLSGPGTVNFYFQNFWSALPQYNLNDVSSHIVANAYYPDVDETNSIFVSWLFGLDTNTGQNRTVPVKTIDRGIVNSMAIAGRDYVVILDSETYKPITSNLGVGINQTLTDDIILIADYLETPVLSIEPGNLNKDRIGARDYYRTHWYENDGGAGTKRTVGAGGTFATITLAVAASAAGDCIEILDSATYDEVGTIAIPHDLTFQAAPKQKPIWKCSAANTTTSIGANIVKIYGIIVEGNNSAADIRIDAQNTSSDLKIIDVLITKISTGAGASGIGVQTGNNLIVENCLFAGNGGRHLIVKKMQNAVTNIDIINSQGDFTNYTYLILDAKGGGTDSTINILYNDVKSNVNTGYGALCQYSDGTGASVGKSIFNIFLNISNLRLYWDNVVSQDLIIRVKGNYFYEMLSVGGAVFVKHNSAVGTTSSLEIIGNIYVDGADLYRIDSGKGNFDIYIKQNICINCGYAIRIQPAATWNSWDNSYNIFYNCDNGLLSDVNNSLNNNIYISNTYAINANAGVVTATNCLYYDNSDTGTVNHTGKITATEQPFIDIDNLNFGWYFNSIMEDWDYWHDCFQSFIYTTITASETLNIKFIEFSGYYGKNCFDTNDVEVTLQYCTIKNFLIAVKSEGEKINTLNSFFETNSIVGKINNAVITEIMDFKNNIVLNNNTGLFLYSGIDFDYNTFLENDYGIYGYFSGLYSNDEYISDYVTIKNSILYESSVYDYYYTLPTNYCIIGSRYYDELLITDINYKITKGDNDYTEKPWLNDNYFPATLYEGYLFNSIAYLNDSAGTGHIGARNENHIKAVFAYTSYTFNDNPYVIPMPIRPIHQQSIYTVLGEYKATLDIFIQAYVFDWTDNAVIDATMRTQLELIFQTAWIVGVSFDNGVSYNYFKVIIDSEFSIQQERYLKIELPFAQTGLEFVEIPGFDITDYEIDTF